MEASALGGPAHNRRVDARHSFGTFTEAHGTTATVWLSGECDAAAAPRLEATLQPLLQNSMRRVWLDMGEVTLLDSVALSVILEARSRLSPSGRLEVLHPSVPVRRLVRAAGFGELLADTDGAAPDAGAMERAIEALPGSQRDVLWEYFGQRRPLHELATRLELSSHQAEQLLTKAMEALQDRATPR